jgi:NAD(P)H-hydrate epimerase
MMKVFPKRSSSSRKGQNGSVAIIGGSRIYHGAPVLSALGALRSGIDLVYLFVPRVIVNPIRSLSPNLIVFPLPDAKITIGVANIILNSIPKIDSAVIGPGLGRQSPDGIKRLSAGLAKRGVKLVLDADALLPVVTNNLKNNEAVLTPHRGEFSRLYGVEIGDKVAEQAIIIREKAEQNGTTILLKGAIDIISDGDSIALNETGTPAMTVGGTGDVLAGIVAANLAKGMNQFHSAAAAAYANGRAGEFAQAKLGFRISPTDLLEELPEVLKPFDQLTST